MAKITPMAQSAKDYLNKTWPNREFIYLDKKNRIWFDKEYYILIHVCKPMKLHHHVTGKNELPFSKFQQRRLLLGDIHSSTSWFSTSLEYRCYNCRKKFTGGIALALDTIVGKAKKLKNE
jgi:hypothetical protein